MRSLIRAGIVVIAVTVMAGWLLAGAAIALAQSGGDGGGGRMPAPPAIPPTAPGYDEAEAQAIDRMLMCPVCPAQTIDQTEVTLAQQMRAQVRELLAGGASRAETLDWFRERYGPGIVAEPPRSGVNLIAWLIPGVVVIIGLAGGIFTLRAMRRPSATISGGDSGAGVGIAGPGDLPSDADTLQPWLDAVDRDLALDDNRSAGNRSGKEPDGGG